MTIILPERVQTEIDIRKAREEKLKDKAYGAGISPWKNASNNTTLRLRNQPAKIGAYNDYYMMYVRHSFVRAAIEKLARACSSTPFRYLPRDPRAKLKARETKALDDFFTDQPNLLAELFEVYKDLFICGDAYLYVIADRAKRPRKLRRIPPQTIIVEADKTGAPIAYYQINPNDPTDRTTQRFEPNEILHFMITDPNNDLYGLSLLESLRWAVNTDLYAQRYNAAFFKNSGMTGTIIAIKSSNTGEISRNKKWLEQNYYGPDAAHTPIVLEGDMDIQVHKAVKSQNEMDFLKGRDYARTEILAVLDIPPAKLGIVSDSNRANAAEQAAGFRNESVRAYQTIIENVINEQLIFNILGIQSIIVRHSESDMSDRIKLMEYYTKGEAFGVFSPNEVREDLGKPPIDGGDVHFLNTPTGSIPLPSLNDYFQLPRPNTDTLPARTQEAANVAKPSAQSQAPTRVTKAADILNDINHFVATQSDGALLSAYANAKSYDIDCAMVIQKAILTTDDLERRGLIYQALQQLQAGVTVDEE